MLAEQNPDHEDLEAWLKKELNKPTPWEVDNPWTAEAIRTNAQGAKAFLEAFGVPQDKADKLEAETRKRAERMIQERNRASE